VGGGEDMLENKVKDNRLSQKIVKSMASIVRGVAKDSVDNRCFFFVHQPEEPKNLAERLNSIKNT